MDAIQIVQVDERDSSGRIREPLCELGRKLILDGTVLLQTVHPDHRTQAALRAAFDAA